MPVSMTGKIEQVEVITSVQRRRRWSAEEKAAIVQETYAPGMSISLVARRHGIAPNQLFRWRRLYTEGALSAEQGDIAVSLWRNADQRAGAPLRVALFVPPGTGHQKFFA